MLPPVLGRSNPDFGTFSSGMDSVGGAFGIELSGRDEVGIELGEESGGQEEEFGVELE